jgi:hypothetical protein
MAAALSPAAGGTSGGIDEEGVTGDRRYRRCHARP